MDLVIDASEAGPSELYLSIRNSMSSNALQSVSRNAAVGLQTYFSRV